MKNLLRAAARGGGGWVVGEEGAEKGRREGAEREKRDFIKL